MNSARFLLTSSLLSLMCISPVVFAGYLTVNIEGHSDSGAFKLLIDKEAIQSSKLNQISVDVAGKSQSFHDTGVNVSFDIGRPGDLFSVKPIFDFTVTGFKLTHIDFDLYIDINPNDKTPGYEIPLKVHYYDKNLFLFDNADILNPKFTPIDPDNPDNTNAIFIFQEVPEPSSLLLFLLGSSLLWIRLRFSPLF